MSSFAKQTAIYIAVSPAASRSTKGLENASVVTTWRDINHAVAFRGAPPGAVGVRSPRSHPTGASRCLAGEQEVSGSSGLRGDWKWKLPTSRRWPMGPEISGFRREVRESPRAGGRSARPVGNARGWPGPWSVFRALWNNASHDPLRRRPWTLAHASLWNAVD